MHRNHIDMEGHTATCDEIRRVPINYSCFSFQRLCSRITFWSVNYSGNDYFLESLSFTQNEKFFTMDDESEKLINSS